MSKESKKILLMIYPFLFYGYIVFYTITEYGIFDSSKNILLRIAGLILIIYGMVYFGVLYRRIKSGYIPDKTRPNYTQMVIYGILGLVSGWIPLLFLYVYGNFKGMDVASVIFYVLWVIYFARIGYNKKRELINF